MAIFIGRNIEKETKAWLGQHQVEFVEQPLIEIELKEPNFYFFHKYANLKKNWIVSSKWSVKWLLLNYKNIGFHSEDIVFCLSEKQALELKRIAKNIKVAKAKNTASLLGLIQKTSSDGVKIFLKGNRSLELAIQKLEEIEVYENKLLKPQVSASFDAILFFSPSGIESFIKGGNKIPDYSTIVSIGETTAAKARAEFPNEIIISQNQNEFEMVNLAYLTISQKQINMV